MTGVSSRQTASVSASRATDCTQPPGEEPRNDGTQEKEQRAVDTQRDDRIATQIGDDRHALHLLAEEHDGENPGESRKIHLKEVSG